MSLRSPVLAAALLLSACSAMAASSANVQLTGVRLQLFDLNPSDGISPSISFTGGASDGTARINFSAPGSSGNEFAGFTGLAGPWSPGSAVVNGPWSLASSSLSGTGMPSGSSLSLIGTATAPAGGFCIASSSPVNQCFEPRSGYDASGSAGLFGGTFVLSANTLLVLSVDASMAVSATGGGIIDLFSDFAIQSADSAFASANISLNGPGPAGSGQQSSSDGRSLNAFAAYNSASGTFEANSQSFTGALSVSFSNLSSAELTGSFSLQASLNGSAAGDARLVPEPGTWGLMLAGLLAVGAITRRARPA